MQCSSFTSKTMSKEPGNACPRAQMSEEGNRRRLCCKALHTNVNMDSRLFVLLTKNIPTLLLLTTGLSDKALYTNLDIDSGLFLAYENRANAPSDVTFNLRDFRAMLSLCEGLRANVAIRFDAPGQPLVVGPHLRGNEAPVSYGLRFLLPPLRACCIGVSIAAGAGSQPAPARRRDAGELWVVHLRVSLGRPETAGSGCHFRSPLPAAGCPCSCWRAASTQTIESTPHRLVSASHHVMAVGRRTRGYGY